jgi:hypothetical protein
MIRLDQFRVGVSLFAFAPLFLNGSIAFAMGAKLAGFELKGHSLELAKVGRFQEAIWMGESSGVPSDKVLGLKKYLRGILDHDSTFKVTQPKLDGVSAKVVLEYPNGVRAIFKHDGGTKLVSRTQVAHDPSKMDVYAADANSEVAASLLDEMLNLNVVPVTVLKNLDLPSGKGLIGSLQVMVSGAEGGKDPYTNTEFFDVSASPPWAVGKRSLLNMMIFDYLSGNSDRHHANWLYVADIQQVVAIDHGLAFRGSEGGCSFNDQIYSHFGIGFSSCDEFREQFVAKVRAKDKIPAGTPVPEDKVQALAGAYLDERLFRADLTKLSPETRAAILAVTPEQVEEVLAPYVRPTYFPRLMSRVVELQRILNKK